MKFEIQKASNWNSHAEKEKYEKLGFTFEQDGYDKDRPWYDSTSNLVVDIEDIFKFIETHGSIVIEENYIQSEPKYLLTIYDDYLE